MRLKKKKKGKKGAYQFCIYASPKHKDGRTKPTIEMVSLCIERIHKDKVTEKKNTLFFDGEKHARRIKKHAFD